MLPEQCNLHNNNYFLIIIIVFWLFLSNKGSKIENDFNLVLETKEANSEEVLDKVIHLFQNNSIDANLFKLETDELSLFTLEYHLKILIK